MPLRLHANVENALTLEADGPATPAKEQALRIRIGGDELAPRRARRQVAALGAELDRSLLETTQLLVTEVVTNSVRHARADAVELAVNVEPDRLRVEVANPGAAFRPRSREESPEPNPGWGLFLVDELSDSWGVQADTTGQRVWFELKRA